MTMNKNQRIQWMKDAKFGLFIHWGLYSDLGGEWKGKTVPYIAEWIMQRLQISLIEYKEIAKSFDPVGFNAREWVSIAKNAGMKYIVITAKHHEGFAMFHSKISKYNIVDATPYKKDPIKELAIECEKQDITLCFYYSHVQDWEDPNGIGNTWDYGEDKGKNFEKYLQDKVKPQLKELLTQYGKVGIIWFDTPVDITQTQAEDLVNFVHQIQPQCIVNSRVGHNLGDYVGFGDNEAPVKGSEICWETCATLNDTWGYKKSDHKWKKSDTIIKLLVDIVSKGGIYLLNIGPLGDGTVPQPSVDVLAEVGNWLKVNGDAIYGTSSSPFEKEFDWGAVTSKTGKLYFHLFDWPKEKFSIRGIENKVKKAYLLAFPNEALSFEQEYSAELGYAELTVRLPQIAPDKDVSVLALEIEGTIKVDNALIQQSDNNIILQVVNAELHHADDAFNDPSKLKIQKSEDLIQRVEITKQDEKNKFYLSKSGVIENWKNSAEWLSWDVKITNPGKFAVEIISMVQKPYAWIGEEIGRWEGGHEISIEIDGQAVTFEVREGERLDNSRSLYYKRMKSTDNCIITIEKPGIHTLKVRPKRLNFKELGFKLQNVNLKYLSGS